VKTIQIAVTAATAVLLAGCVYAAPGTVYQQAPAYASYCAAGVYQCPLPSGTPVGATCSCPGLGAPSYGVAQ
jgi:hypothetical protein